MRDDPKDSIGEFERAIEEQQTEEQKIMLRLYIGGMNAKARRAIENIEKTCAGQLKGRCILEVIDIKEKPRLAKGEQIIAIPTLIKEAPAPLRTLIGDLAAAERVLVGLDVKFTGIQGSTS